MFTPDWAAALREFDEREREIADALAHFASRTDREGKRVYRMLQRDYGREMAQIGVRRRMIAPMLMETKPGQK